MPVCIPAHLLTCSPAHRPVWICRATQHHYVLGDASPFVFELGHHKDWSKIVWACYFGEDCINFTGVITALGAPEQARADKFSAAMRRFGAGRSDGSRI
jgi:hypothetical protein